MQPTARPQATLVDLLDRVLDRGLIINADIVITLAGVPLIGINLRAALGGMETMVRYGLLKDWDDSIRAQEQLARDAIRALAPVAADGLVGAASAVTTGLATDG